MLLPCIYQMLLPCSKSVVLYQQTSEFVGCSSSMSYIHNKTEALKKQKAREMRKIPDNEFPLKLVV